MVSDIPSFYPLDSKASLGHVNKKCLLNPSTDEWIKKMWCIYTREYYSATGRNDTGSFVMMWMNLESVMQSEVSQKEKNKNHINAHMCIYMESRKMALMKLMCRAVIRDTEQTRGHSKGRRRDNLKEEPWHTYMPCVKRRLGEAVTWCGRPAGCSVMTQTGGRRRGGRQLKTEGMCGIAGSLCCAWWLAQHCEAIIFQ